MSEDVEDEASAPPEAFVRVRTISNLTSFKRHLLRMFDQGQPGYPDAYDADDDPWNLWPEMVPDFVEDWRPIRARKCGSRRPVIAVVLTFSMPAGTDVVVNEAAVLAVIRREFVGRDQIWVAGEHEGPFVKLLVAYRDEDGRPLSPGPADLRRYRKTYASELEARGVVAVATARRSRGLKFGEGRDAYKERLRSSES
ncbi:hypothetical protein [Sphingomonas sp. BAUL-RG-20F-R05-02]|uniref:hypothetical protein n=1 Tax=Sphingomonas sp. BAUL-RG-20F-R05-02 TaxID=2914830 RepID=UPI001F57275E|nr:hypothetical protein [Sphingomonas sp. BAUL-RG-20F-R05-02]